MRACGSGHVGRLHAPHRGAISDKPTGGVSGRRGEVEPTDVSPMDGHPASAWFRGRGTGVCVRLRPSRRLGTTQTRWRSGCDLTTWRGVGRHSGGLSKLQESARQIRKLIAGIEATRIRQHPDLSAGDRLGLGTHHGRETIESSSIRADPENRDPPWPVPGDLAPQSRATGLKLTQRQLVRRGGGPGHQVGNAAPECRQVDVFIRGQQARSEPGREKGRPEPVPRPREVVTGRTGVEPRVDAAEEHAETGCDHVAKDAAPRGVELCLGGSRHVSPGVRDAPAARTPRLERRDRARPRRRYA